MLCPSTNTDISRPSRTRQTNAIEEEMVYDDQLDQYKRHFLHTASPFQYRTVSCSIRSLITTFSRARDRSVAPNGSKIEGWHGTETKKGEKTHRAMLHYNYSRTLIKIYRFLIPLFSACWSCRRGWQAANEEDYFSALS